MVHSTIQLTIIKVDGCDAENTNSIYRHMHALLVQPIFISYLSL